MPPLTTPPAEIGWKAEDFRLLATDGKYYCLDDIRKNNGFVIAFICNHCPYVKAIAGKIVDTAKALAEVGVGFIAINPNDPEAYPEDSFENMKVFAKERGFFFPYVVDSTQIIAETYNAVCTPDFFGFDKKNSLIYRGRLDDTGKESDKVVERRELYEAMLAVAQGKVIDLPTYPSIGCSIKWRQD